MSLADGVVAGGTAQRRRPAWFRKRYAMPRLSPDAQLRQGQVSTLAFLALGRNDALHFLNTPDDRLGGRPLDLATTSEEGLAKVRQAIDVMACRPD